MAEDLSFRFSQKNVDIDIFRDFFIRLRQLALIDACIIIHDPIWPKLKFFMRTLLDIKFEDGNYHIYYGKIKDTLSSFMIYFKVTMDEIIKESDRCSNVMTRDELLYLVDNSISIHEMKHVEFCKEYLPVISQEEKKFYEDMEQQFEALMDQMYELKAKIKKLDKQFKVDDFSKEHFKIPVRKTYRLFCYSQSYFGIVLADNVDKIRICLEEILLRMRNNLKREMTAAEEYQNKLLHDLYDKNKEQLALSRRDRKCSIEFAEVSRSIQLLRDKIENFESANHILRIKEEVEYWEHMMEEFRPIYDVIEQIKKEQQECAKEQGIYDKLMCTELPGAKLEAWTHIGNSYNSRQIYLGEKMVLSGKALLTFFTIKGSDRICYTDHVGRFFIDDYNHQVYPFDYALKVYHLNCEGQFKECPDADPYYFDEIGRYIYKDGEKIYQCAPCTSQYQLGEDYLLKKITKDCGHTERLVDTCRLDIGDPGVVEMLPTTEPVDITKSLDSEAVEYLWKSLGGLLPDALYDIGISKPVNPIHVLAHKLLFHKYGRTIDEVKQKNEDAQNFRADILKKKQDRAAAEFRDWKSKQVKRRKPEESDDSQDVATYAAHVQQMDFITSLNYYN